MEFVHAIDNNDIEYVKHIINNTDVNIDSGQYTTGNTALNYAAMKNNLDIVKLLVKGGANLEKENDNGETPLYNAVHHNNIEIVKFLIKSGANINKAEALDHYTPLHLALFGPGYQLDLNSYKKFFNIATLLIKSGANLDAETSPLHRTPLHMLINTSIQINVDFNDKDAKKLKKDVIKITKLLIQGGANVNALDNDNNTPLHYAFKVDVVDDEPMRDNDIELAYILLEAGAKLNLRNNDGETPYEVADVDDLARFDMYLKLTQIINMRKKKIRERAMTKRVNKTLVRSRKIPSDLGPLIAEYGAGVNKLTRRRDQKKSKKKRRKKRVLIEFAEKN